MSPLNTLKLLRPDMGCYNSADEGKIGWLRKTPVMTYFHSFLRPYMKEMSSISSAKAIRLQVRQVGAG